MLYEYPDEFIVAVTYVDILDKEKVDRVKNDSNDIFNEFIESGLINPNDIKFYLKNMNVYNDSDTEYASSESK